MFNKISNTAIIPSKAHPQDAGYDLTADSDYYILPGKAVKISTGLTVNIPVGYFGGVYSRSGLAIKQGLVVLQGVGVIDAGYTGELIVLLYNTSDISASVKKGDRVAQLIVQPIYLSEFETYELNSATATRGDGGFGSTGVV